VSHFQNKGIVVDEENRGKVSDKYREPNLQIVRSTSDLYRPHM
jgi:hypothetical protein